MDDKQIKTLDHESRMESKYSTLTAIINAVNDGSSKLILGELRTILGNTEVRNNIRNGIMPYIYAAGFLSYAGREITSQSLSRTIASIGVKPNEKFIDVLLKTGVKSHLVYLYAFYFLLANGKMASENDIRKVIEAVDMEPDRDRILEILDMVKNL